MDIASELAVAPELADSSTWQRLENRVAPRTGV